MLNAGEKADACNLGGLDKARFKERYTRARTARKKCPEERGKEAYGGSVQSQVFSRGVVSTGRGSIKSMLRGARGLSTGINRSRPSWIRLCEGKHIWIRSELCGP